jgi:hypothetical protein
LEGNPCIDCRGPSLLDDANYTEENLFTNLRGYRYMELFISYPGAGMGIYNTMGFNIQPDDSRDSFPVELEANYSDEQAKAKYNAAQVWMSGVRHWTIDAFRVYTGMNVRNFDGADTRWGASVAVPDGYDISQGEASYTVTNVSRDSTFYFDKGKEVFILDAPDGTSYMMQSYALIVDPNQTYEDLPTLGDRLDLPEGWSYRVEVLEEDLVMTGINGTEWHVIQDDLKNSYSGCWESGDQAVCSYQP